MLHASARGLSEALRRFDAERLKSRIERSPTHSLTIYIGLGNALPCASTLPERTGTTLKQGWTIGSRQGMRLTFPAQLAVEATVSM